MPDERDEVEIANEVERDGSGRYVLRVDGHVAAFADYRRDGAQLSFTHTVTEPEYRGRGLAGRLIELALTEAKGADDEVLPYCSFVSKYIGAHEEYLELVPTEHRAEFGLPA